MRRIYAILGVVLIVAAFWLGYKIGSPAVDISIEELNALNRRYDSLSGEIAASQRREKWFADQAEKDLKEIDSLKTNIITRNVTHTLTQNRYGAKIKQVENYSLDELDSFLIDLYPSPGVRKITYNPDGTPRNRIQEHPEMEVKNDSPTRDQVRFIDERISEVVQGQHRPKSYCGQAGACITDEGWGVAASQGSEIALAEPGVSTRSEVGVLATEIQEGEEAEEIDSGSWINSYRGTYLLSH